MLESDSFCEVKMRLEREIETVGLGVEDMLNFYLFVIFWMFQWFY